MQAVKMLHQRLNESGPEIHAYRWTALMAGVEALVTGQTLTVTGLGRALPRDISRKHGIKQSDRLVGNVHLFAERRAIYEAVCRRVIGDWKRPLIVIDWSDYTHDRAQQ